MSQLSNLGDKMSDCLFCKLAKGDIPSNKVYEDEKTIAFLDVSPVAKGHTLVIPKEHAVKIYEMSQESGEALINTVKKVSLAIERTFNCDFNIINNNGKKAGQAVDHAHIHIIPRNDSSEFGFKWPKTEYNEGEDKEILDKIKDNL